jgi:ATP-binding cassette subfamily B protein
MEKERLPQNIANAVRGQHPDEDILISISSDITGSGSYGEEWLIVTDKHLLTFSADTSQPSQNLAISKIKKISAENRVGSGVVEMETESGIFHIMVFTEARSADFHNVVDGIRELMKGCPLSAKHTSSERATCAKCHRPVPQDMTVCPYCTEKKQVLMRLLRFSIPYTRQLLTIVLITTLMTLCSLATPYMSKLFIDYIFKFNPETGGFMYPEWHLACVGILFVTYALQSVFAGFHERVSGSTGFRTIYDVRTALYRKIQEVSLAFFDKRHTGAIMARINQDTAELQRMLVDFLPMTLDAFMTLIGVGALLFWLSWRLTLFVLLPIIATSVS